MHTFWVVRRALPVIAFIVFSFGVGYSVYELHNKDVNFKLDVMLVLVLFSGPLSMHMAVRRFQVVARLYGGRFHYLESLKVVVYGGLANMLPLPGGLMVRIGALQQRIGAQKSLYGNAIGVLVWISLGALSACVALFFETTLISPIPFLLFFVISIAAVFAFAVFTHAEMGAFLSLCGVQCILALTNILRLWLICVALGYLVAPAFPALVSLGEIVASSAGIVPGGMGLAETIAAVIAKVFDHSPVLGFAIAGTNRLINFFCFILGLAVMFFYRNK